MDPPRGDGHCRPVSDLVAAAGVRALEDARSKTQGTQASALVQSKIALRPKWGDFGGHSADIPHVTLLKFQCDEDSRRCSDVGDCVRRSLWHPAGLSCFHLQFRWALTCDIFAQL